MLSFQYEGRALVGDDLRDFGLSDVRAITNTNGDGVLVAVSKIDGKVYAWSLAGDGLPVLSSVRAADEQLVPGQSPTLMDFDDNGTPGVLIAGVAEEGIGTSEVNTTGGIRSIRDIDTGESGWTHGVQLDSGLIATAHGTQSGFAIFDSNASLIWTELASVSDTNSSYASEISKMDTVQVDGVDVLLVASESEMGVSSYTVTGATVQMGDNIGSQDGTGLLTPTDLGTVTIDGTSFVVIASASGGMGALSVMEIDETGALTPTDHAYDTLATRFGQVQTIDVQAYGDGAFVVAGGGDDGLSLLSLTSEGRLVHLTAFEDTVSSGLTDVSALDIQVNGTTLDVYVTSGADAGISVLSVDLTDVGTVATNDTDGGLISGTSGNDVLVGSALTDTFDGGQGADVFVVTSDGAAEDIIRSFDPNEDRIDLSAWPQLYSVDDLSIWTTGQGARIRFGEEQIFVKGVDNQPLDPEEVRAAVCLDLHRLPTIPQASQSVEPGDGDSVIEGTWGMDTLSGGDGDDTLFGYEGDDLLYADPGNDFIFGGDGADEFVFAVAHADVTIRRSDEDSVTVETAQGIDTLEGIEVFTFSDQSMSIEDFLPSEDTPPLTLNGTAGEDTVIGTNGNDTLTGFGGDDIFISGLGNDRIFGDGGIDTVRFEYALSEISVLKSQDGTVTIETPDGTDVISGVEVFAFADQTIAATKLEVAVEEEETGDPVDTGPAELFGTANNDTLRHLDGDAVIYGYGGNDNLEATVGNDMLDGGDGNDAIRGRAGDDVLYGGAGDDQIWGHEGNDIVFGGAGKDLIRTADGSDVVYGGADRDVINGGNESDELYGEAGNDVVSGQRHGDVLFGGIGDDRIFGGGGNDVAYGNEGNDFLKGGIRRDELYGGEGNDLLVGNNFDDLLYGGDGNDRIFSGEHNDTLDGGSGDDFLRGGSGRDTFIFKLGDDFDTVSDLAVDQDYLLLDTSLFDSAITAVQVVESYAVVVSNGVMLDFGNGDQMLLSHVSDLDGLSDIIEFI